MSISSRKIMHLLFPPRCPFCDEALFHSLFAETELVCSKCRDSLEYIREPVCKKCGKPMREERQEYCFDCSRKKMAYVQGKALWPYRGAVKQSLYRFKYRNRQEYARFYGQELADVYGEWIRRRGITAIIPIPLSKARMRRRGFNQAQLVAKEAGKRLGLPVYDDLLLRVRDTKAQKALSGEERKNNLKKAFKIKENKVQLGHILLIDDIYTTGSTMNEAAKELARAGAREVYCLSISIGSGY